LDYRPRSRSARENYKLRDLDCRTLLNCSASRNLARCGSHAGDPALPSPP